MKWNIYQSFPIQLAFFDDQIVVFHHGSGETHLLDKNASLILSTIMESEVPICEPALLGMAIEAGLGSVDSQTLAGVLGALQNLQIIEKI
ncbi:MULTISPECIES: HPr-rel-A system PqqD family peptide chaperone [Methylomonas]|uniref:HPr-rel-A system PqqD family peptide chaperone n=1 Tax=Methylomonas TaxID=416 RepID=UPI001404D7B1|nr:MULTISPECIES: HPr-rel-A system PqqD family peptide chaperone [Methylomonas]